jgi:hypothetical protein
MGKGVVALVDDLMIHRPMKLWMRMQDHRDRRILLLGRMIAAFEAARGAGKNDFRHGWSLAKSTSESQASSGAPEEPREEEDETDVWAKPDRRPVMKAGF